MLSLDKAFDAQVVLKKLLRETKLVRVHGISLECERYLKPENLQITGAHIRELCENSSNVYVRTLGKGADAPDHMYSQCCPSWIRCRRSLN